MGIDEIALAHADERDLTQLAEYEAIGGYEALRKARGMEPGKIVEELMNANLRGRGGAGFPMGRKASFLAKGTGKPTYLCVNADESEPGTFKDREIMLKNPHRLIEGCLVTAHGIESKNVFIYLRGEYLDVFEVMRGALEQTRAAGLLEDVTIVLHRGAGAYICGEESALLESLEGNRGQPRSRPPFPAVSGLYGSPTLINNVQTVATVPPIIQNGAEWYAAIGPETSPGTVVFSVSGNIVNPGNYELELGTPMRELIYDLGGGIPDGRELKAIIPGGSSTTVMTPDLIDTALDYNSVAEVGSQFGAAALIVIDDRACMVQLALALDAVLHARVVREVHAVPRGDALDGAAPARARGGPGRPGAARPAGERRRPDHGALPVRAGRLRRRPGPGVRADVPRGVPAAHRRGRVPLRRRVLARGDLRAGRPASRPPDRRGAVVTRHIFGTLSCWCQAPLRVVEG